MKQTSLLWLMVLAMPLAAVLAEDLPAVASAATRLRAGVASIDISPRTLPALMNGGFLQNSSNRVADPLHARALVLADERETIAIVIVDSCMVPRELCDSVKQRVAAATAIRSDRILIAATHTHTAPSVMEMCLGCGRDEPYVALFAAQVAHAIEEAAENLKPAMAGWAVVEAADLTNCRRWITRSDMLGVDPFGEPTVRAMMHPGYLNPAYTTPAGPIDPWLSVLSVVEADGGAPLCVLGNLSMHYFGSGGGFSADYFGEVAQILEQRLGEGGNGRFVGIMSQGTSGDLHWMNYGQPQRGIGRREYAVEVARRIEEACQGIEHRGDLSLAAAERRITLRRRRPSPERLAWAAGLNATRGDEPPRNQPEVYAQQAAWIDQHPVEELVLQAMRIGELGITAIPCEVYGITGLKLKRQSPLATTFNMELANGAAGYIPPPEQHLLGGYTTWPARTAGLEESAEPQIVDTVLELLETVAQRPREPLMDPTTPFAEAVLRLKPCAYWRLGDMQAGRVVDATGLQHAAHQGAVALYLPGPGAPGFATSEPYGNRAVYLAGGHLLAELAGVEGEASVSLWFCNQLPCDARDATGALLSLDGVSLAIAGLAAGGRAGVVELKVGGSTAYGRTPLSVGGWHHLTLTRDAEQLRVFLDGKPEAEIALPHLPAPGSGLLLIGKTDGRSPTFDGLVDEIAVFPHSLTAEDVANLYAASGMSPPPQPRRAQQLPAKPADAEARERYAQSVRASRPSRYWRLQESPDERQDRTPLAAISDAETDLVAAYEPGVMPGETGTMFAGGRLAIVGDAPETSSVEFWFRNDLPSTSRPVTAYLLSHGVDGRDGAAGDNLGIGGTHSHAGKLFVFTGNDDNRLVAGATPLIPGSWAHVVFVRSGDRVKVYLNGNPTPEIDEELPAVMPPGCRDLFIGGRSDNFANLQGAIEEVAVYGRELTPQEVQAHFESAGVVAIEGNQVEPAADLSPPLPTDACDALETIHIREGFAVELVAAEPLVADPVAIDWGPDGTLWVAEMADYPLGLDGKGKPGGRVRRLEDTDGDGSYDRSTLFAEGLRFPTGILSWQDGVLVTAAPEIVFLRDADGDGRAEEPEVLYSGFLEGNQQLRVNGLRWGLDNWVACASGSHHAGYGSESTIRSHRTGEQVAVGSRDFRIRPDTGEIEPLSGPSQYGRNRDDWGNWFGVQNSHPLWHYVLADQDIRRNPHFAPPDPKWQVITPANPPVYPASSPQKRYHSFEQSGRFTSACSAMVYRDSLLFPLGEQQHAFTCEPFHNLVQHNLIEADGPTFTARRDPAEGNVDFFASSDPWCRPVMVRTGPDGGLWVVDMYRFMIEHPDWLPENGKDELRPWYRAGSDRGRIYRIVPQGQSAPRPPVLSAEDPDALVAALASSNGVVRDMAQRMLVRSGRASLREPLELLLAESSNPRARLHALCTLDGLGCLAPATLQAALDDPHAGVRRQAVRLAAATPVDLSPLLARLDDGDAAVRLELAATLGRYPGQEAALGLARLLGDPESRGYVAAAAMTSLTPENVWPVLQAVGEQGDSQAQLRATLMSQAIAMGDAATLERVVSLACGDQPRSLAGVLDELGKRPGAIDSLGEVVRLQVAASIEAARQITADDGVPPNLRADAVRLLARETQRRADDVALLKRLLMPQSPIPLQHAILEHLASRSEPDVADILLAGWQSHSPQLRAQILEVLPTRPAWSQVLRERVSGGVVAPQDLAASVRQRLISEGAEQDAWRALLANTTTSSSREVARETYKRALDLAGEPSRGEPLFRRLCLPCHTLGDEGHAVGPQLASITNKSRESIFTAIIDPSSAVDATYLNYVLLTTDGRQFAGRLAAETASSITLLASGGVTHTVLREEIEALQSSRQSLMPEGLEQDLEPADLADLIDFVRVAFSEDVTESAD